MTHETKRVLLFNISMLIEGAVTFSILYQFYLMSDMTVDQAVRRFPLVMGIAFLVPVKNFIANRVLRRINDLEPGYYAPKIVSNPEELPSWTVKDYLKYRLSKELALFVPAGLMLYLYQGNNVVTFVVFLVIFLHGCSKIIPILSSVFGKFPLGGGDALNISVMNLCFVVPFIIESEGAWLAMPMALLISICYTIIRFSFKTESKSLYGTMYLSKRFA